MAENPLWSEAQNAFLWTDIFSAYLYKLTLEDNKVTKIPVSPLPDGREVMISCFAEATDGGFVCTFNYEGFGRFILDSDADGVLVAKTELLDVPNPLASG